MSKRRIRKRVVEPLSQQGTHSNEEYTVMTNNIVHFPRQDDPAKEGFLDEKQGVLKRRLTDLRNNPTKESSYQKTSIDQVQEDVNSQTKTQLKEKYPLTHSSWRNRKSFVKKNGRRFHPEFMEFSSFLLIMGPRPNKHYTLDRIDNSNLDYGPGLCRWADKTKQANNRSSTIHLTYNGECLPLTVWAKRTNQKADTLRNRHQKGWTDEEVIEGKRKTAGKKSKYHHTDVCWKGPIEERVRLEMEYRRECGWRKSILKICRNRYQFYLDHLGDLASGPGLFLQNYDLGHCGDVSTEYIREQKAKLEEYTQLYCSVKEEYWAWQKPQPKRLTKEEEIAKFISESQEQII